MINNKTASEYLITTFISRGIQNSLTFENTNMKATVSGRTFPLNNILSRKYRGIILENSFELNLDSDELFETYKFKPKLLSLKLYGTTDLWHLILWLNDMNSATQFTRRRVVIFDPEAMDVLNRIIEKEKLNLLQNNSSPEEAISEEKINRR